MSLIACMESKGITNFQSSSKSGNSSLVDTKMHSASPSTTDNPTFQVLTKLVEQYMRVSFEAIYGVPTAKIFLDCKNHILASGLASPQDVETYEKELRCFFISSKSKGWFTGLRKRKYEQMQKVKQERNTKIRKLDKLPQFNFFTDEFVLLHILRYLDLDSLYSLKQTNSYFIKLIRDNWNVLATAKHVPLIELPAIALSTQKMVSVYIRTLPSYRPYKQICLLSGIKEDFVSELVTSYCLQKKPNAIYKLNQITKLISATNGLLQYISPVFINETLLGNQFCKVKSVSFELDCPTLVYRDEYCNTIRCVNNPEQNLFIFVTNLLDEFTLPQHVQNCLAESSVNFIGFIATDEWTAVKESMMQVRVATVLLVAKDRILFKSEKTGVIILQRKQNVVIQETNQLDQKFVLDHLHWDLYVPNVDVEVQVKQFFENISILTHQMQQHARPNIKILKK